MMCSVRLLMVDYYPPCYFDVQVQLRKILDLGIVKVVFVWCVSGKTWSAI